jgi:hypothetical protein
MQGTVEYEYGGTAYQIPQYDDGRYDCPLCSNHCIFDELKHLGLHFAKGHNMHNKQTVSCPECGDEFTFENNNERTYCSKKCAATATNRERAQP